MEIMQALGIINEYAATLRHTDFAILALPESLLPCDKPTVKDAIRTLLPLADSDSIASALRDAYVDLATFVDDSEAGVIMEAQRAVEVGDTTAPCLDEATRIGERIVAERDVLVDEVQNLPAQSRA